MVDIRFYKIMQENDCTKEYEGPKPIPDNWTACDFENIAGGNCRCFNEYSNEQHGHLVRLGKTRTMRRAEILTELTKLYDICISNSEKEIINDSCHYKLDNSWFRIAGAISNAEDVVIQEIGKNV